MMNSDESVTGPVNLGNPSESTVLELAEKIIQMVGSDSKIIFCPLPGDDPTQRRPDISYAGKALGWQPEINLEQGLASTISYYRGLRGKR